MATAQSQFPSGELPQITEESEPAEKQGWGSYFGWGKKTKEESLDDSSYSAFPKDLQPAEAK